MDKEGGGLTRESEDAFVPLMPCCCLVAALGFVTRALDRQRPQTGYSIFIPNRMNDKF